MNLHKDCKYYLAIDVFKGICKRDKKKINADDEACDKFETIAKCKHCNHYSGDDDYLGKCKNAALTYADMTAVTCAEFEWKEKK